MTAVDSPEAVVRALYGAISGPAPVVRGELDVEHVVRLVVRTGADDAPGAAGSGPGADPSPRAEDQP